MSVLLKVFTAPWCQPCKAMAPLFDQLGVPYTKIDISEQEQVAMDSGVKGVPFLILEKDGNEVGRHQGPMQLHQLRTWVSDLTQ